MRCVARRCARNARQSNVDSDVAFHSSAGIAHMQVTLVAGRGGLGMGSSTGAAVVNANVDVDDVMMRLSGRVNASK